MDTGVVIPETKDGDAGSMLISLNDGCKDGIWSILKILDKWIEKKIISHPFLVTKNNTKASESLRTIRRAAGGEKANSGVSTTLQEDFEAKLAIEVTPQISSLDRLNLQIRVDIEDFIETTTFNRTIRSVETNANMSSGQVLVLGGLTKVSDGESETRWPILSRIPIIGNLFKGSIKTKVKNNLVIFIHPTIVDPKLRAGINKYTDDKIENEYNLIETGNLFTKIKDPVTRFFFRSSSIEEGEDMLNEYLKATNYKKQSNNSSYVAVDNSNEIKNLFKDVENPF